MQEQDDSNPPQVSAMPVSAHQIDSLARYIHAALSECGEGHVGDYSSHNLVPVEGRFDFRKLARRLLLDRCGDEGAR